MRTVALLVAMCVCCGVQAADSDARAAFKLGLMYRNTAHDSAAAVRWLTVAAQRGEPAAMFILSNMLDAGEGTARDEKAARAWLEAAAELEYPEALQQLALSEPDPERAAQLMREAAHALTHRHL
jgi:TPR repeat protein